MFLSHFMACFGYKGSKKGKESDKRGEKMCIWTPFDPVFTILLHIHTRNNDLCNTKNDKPKLIYLKSATKPLNVLIAFTRPLITEFADNLNLKHPLLPTISPYPTM
jgi:hypothetical protein